MSTTSSLSAASAAVLPENEEARDKRDLIARLGGAATPPPGDAEPEAPPAYDAAAPQRGNLDAFLAAARSS